MDPILMALTRELQAKAQVMRYGDDLAMRFAAADMLDYLGVCIDERKHLPKSINEKPPGEPEG